MPEIAAAITSTGTDSEKSKAQTAAANSDPKLSYRFGDKPFFVDRKPDYYVYLFNVSRQTFEVNRPPVFPKLVIKANEKGKEYTAVISIPEPLVTRKQNIDSGEIEYIPLNAVRYTMDILNPDNPTTNQDFVVTGSTSANTNDLGRRGVFFSLSNPPKKEEVEAARKRMEAHYTRLLEEADTTEVSDPKMLQTILRPEHHHACEYFGYSRTWHTKNERPTQCPNCGEAIKAGSFMHMNGGVPCILDWKRAYESGAVEASRVPRAKRWATYEEDTK